MFNTDTDFAKYFQIQGCRSCRYKTLTDIVYIPTVPICFHNYKQLRGGTGSLQLALVGHPPSRRETRAGTQAKAMKKFCLLGRIWLPYWLIFLQLLHSPGPPAQRWCHLQLAGPCRNQSTKMTTDHSDLETSSFKIPSGNSRCVKLTTV